MQHKWKYTMSILALMTAVVWLAVATYPVPELRVISCDVGQGDATLAIYGKVEILVDGGPGRKVLDCLSENIPFWDRHIELVVMTHPQKDHFEGLVEVFRRYDVEVFLADSLDSSSQEYSVLKKVVGGSGARVVDPVDVESIRFGLLHLDILHPKKEFVLANSEVSGLENRDKVLGTTTSKRDANDFSVVAILSLGKFDALLTGDMGPKISDMIAKKLATQTPAHGLEYIKIPHHGSKNGISEKLLDVNDFKIAVISVGAKNSYGHPHKEILDMLTSRDIDTLRTDLNGNIVVVSDGKSFWIGK